MLLRRAISLQILVGNEYSDMFRSFFLSKKWLPWSVPGSLLILGVTWYKVQLDVQINVWFGDFYNTIQEALANPHKVTFDEFLLRFYRRRAARCCWRW